MTSEPTAGVIREFAPEDYPAVAAVWRRSGTSVIPAQELEATPSHGPGLMLVAEARAAPGRAGSPRINLLVLPDNASGLAFWSRVGYLAHADVLCSNPVAATPPESGARVPTGPARPPAAGA